MSIKLSEVKSIQLLPVFMQQDEANIALCKAVDELIKDPAERAATLRVWDQIDNMSNPALDELAWELDIEWWVDTWDIYVKRNTIKTATLIKRKQGTVWAVSQTTANVFNEAFITEWYEYGGKPHHFKVTTLESISTAEEIRAFYKLVSASKMASAVFDGIETQSEIQTKLYFVSVPTAIRMYTAAVAVNE